MSTYESITAVGGLLPTSLLERARAGAKDLEGTSPESYGLVPGERLNDQITRSWNRLKPVWASFVDQLAALPEQDRATTLTRSRWCRQLFDELGFAGLPSASGVEIDGKQYALSNMWADRVPIHIMGARLGIDRRASGVAGAALSSPHGLVQEFLNRSDDHLWGIVTNGLLLRILRDNASLTKQAYVEFDLDAMFAGDLFSDFVVLWLTCHRTRFEGDPPEKCLLERWSVEASDAGTRALDKLRDGVEQAITALGSGFVAHKANGELREQIRSDELSSKEVQHQVLRIVYRLLFLLVAESRDLLHAKDANPTAVERYKRYYSVDRLRTLATQRRGSPHDDLWTGLNVVMNGLWHDGVPSLGLSPLGSSLWAPDSISALRGASLDNLHLLDAIRSLCLVHDDEAKSVSLVDYKNLGAEELGSVYESLLELHADVDADAKTFALTTAAGNERKTTGSYYTPTSLISELLDSALDPVLDEAARKPDPEAAILGLNIVDPAAGSGHFLIAAAHRIAGRLASVRAGGGEPAPDELRHALRDVVGNCIHAIDVNPMAVELCKVSMWLEGTEPGKPLNFLDHRIVCGNALIGTTPELLEDGIPDDAFVALTGDDKAVVTSLKQRNKAARKGAMTLFSGGGESIERLAAAVDEIDAIPETSIDAVEQKAQAWADLTESEQYRNELFAADLWCSAFVVSKVGGEPEILHDTYRLAVEHPQSVPGVVRAAVTAASDEYAFLHLHLAFLDVFDADGSGGFDVVLGNPPWEKVKLSEKEFFAARDPDIASLAGTNRKKAIARLEQEDPTLFAELQAALRHTDGESHFIRKSGRYPLCGRGDVNTYAVFAESMRNATSPTGRTGVIVPTGIATDDTTKFFFADCVDGKRLSSLFDFENRERLFAEVHSSMKFCLLTLSGAEMPVDKAEFAFFAQQTSDLSDLERRFTLSPEELALINPNTKTAPVFRSRRDARITAKIYRHVPVLVREDDPDGNPWRVEFSRMMELPRDSEFCLTAEALQVGPGVLAGNHWVTNEGRFVPYYEGKMAVPFDHRAADVVLSPTAVTRQGQPRYVTADEHSDPTRLAQPRAWVSESLVSERLGTDRCRWLLGWRDITSPTNERTMLPVILPLSAVDGGILLISSEADDLVLVGASLASFVLDFVTRQKVGGVHLKYFTVRQLPVPAPESFRVSAPWSAATICDWMSTRLLELICTSVDLLSLSEELGVGPASFEWMPARRELLQSEVDAAFFHIYGLDRDDVDYIMDTFPIVRRKDEAAHGEFRTKRLILERYDAMAEAAANGTEYQTVLDPPPADPSLAHDPATRPEWADWYLTGGL